MFQRKHGKTQNALSMTKTKKGHQRFWRMKLEKRSLKNFSKKGNLKQGEMHQCLRGNEHPWPTPQIYYKGPSIYDVHTEGGGGSGSGGRMWTGGGGVQPH